MMTTGEKKQVSVWILLIITNESVQRDFFAYKSADYTKFILSFRLNGYIYMCM